MRILLINEVCGHTSTGRICGEIADRYADDGHDVKIAYGRSAFVPKQYKKYAVRIGNTWDVSFHALKTRIFDMHGFGSRGPTKRFLEWAERYDPNIVWLHNLHGYYINIESLFQWIKTHPELEVRWTLHDCWSFTGHCAYFTMAECNRWKDGCHDCPQKGGYPASIVFDRSEKNYLRKKELFTGIQRLKIITPSNWLAELVKSSFLSEYPVEVQRNTIDQNVFKPVKSDFREKYGFTDKRIVLGVANIWEKRKGLDDFIQLSRMLDDTYVIVLVGLTQKKIKSLLKKGKTTELIMLEAVSSQIRAVSCNDLKCIEAVKRYGGIAVPKGVENLYKEITENKWDEKVNKFPRIYCLPKTGSKEELAMVYSAADFFVNPTYEDTFPTTNLEALACGAYVITYDIGGSKETLI